MVDLSNREREYLDTLPASDDYVAAMFGISEGGVRGCRSRAAGTAAKQGRPPGGTQAQYARY